MIDTKLQDKVVLISGANHGIGAAAAEAFATQEAQVFITYYRDACQHTKEELQKAEEAGIGGDMLYRAMQQKSADHLVQKIVSNGGKALHMRWTYMTRTIFLSFLISAKKDLAQ